MVVKDLTRRKGLEMFADKTSNQLAEYAQTLKAHAHLCDEYVKLYARKRWAPSVKAMAIAGAAHERDTFNELAKAFEFEIKARALLGAA